MCFRLKVEFQGSTWTGTIFYKCFKSDRFLCPDGFLSNLNLFAAQKFQGSTWTGIFFIKSFISDSCLVIGVPGRPQNFYCDLYLVRGISAAFSRVPLAFYYSFFILLLPYKL
ncbi:hypothetical protein PUN28_004246 [Cardiocondyla obscurior]|uniref:Uncharacterized protein n=1 Tax=Cardiocondyla obscurior TaxID=286306 RepID=A0AAW2GQ80_9HYME